MNPRRTSPVLAPACATVAIFLLLAPTTGCDTLQGARGAEGLFDLVKPATPEDAVEAALDEYDPDRRYRGTAELANASFASADPYLRLFEDAARDTDAGVRQVGVRALGIHGTPEHVPLLIERLEDDEWLVRHEAARSLQRLHGDEAVVPLVERLDRENETVAAVRAEAAHALGQFPEQRVLQSLIQALGDPNLAVNHNTVLALEFLTGQNLGYEPAAWLAWLDETDAPFAAGRVYTYPGFERDKIWFEHLPFLGAPPFEAESIPVGLGANRDAGGS